MQFNVCYAFQVILQGFFMIALLNYEIYGYEYPNCPLPTFPNGKMRRTRIRSMLIRYFCNPGYALVGHRYASCIYGEWNDPAPVCVRSGCPEIGQFPNGQKMYTVSDAVIMFLCHPGYVLNGDSNIHCNGTHWNSTLPTCSNENSATMLSCDFEKDDLCGWFHDPIHDFDWSRENRKTPNGHMGTGPSYDHTLGPDKDGYYMYIESMSREENDTARLLSPLYPPEFSKNGCFSFYYHMYGRTIGMLRVYQRPETILLSSIAMDTYLQRKYVMFEKSGNQGNHWYTGFFELNELHENFQLVIEGVRGPGYVSDIAIDDIALLQNEQCAERLKEHLAIAEVPVRVRDSCLNRCDSISNSQTIECQCDVECSTSRTCCPDYNDFCAFEDNETTVYNTDHRTMSNSYDESSTTCVSSTTSLTIVTDSSSFHSETEENFTELKTTTPSTNTTNFTNKVFEDVITTNVVDEEKHTEKIETITDKHILYIKGIQKDINPADDKGSNSKSTVIILVITIVILIAIIALTLFLMSKYYPNNRLTSCLRNKIIMYNTSMKYLVEEDELEHDI